MYVLTSLFQIENSGLLRLIEFDDSKEFKIIACINDYNEKEEKIQVSKQTCIDISTTINKAHIISRNVDRAYENNRFRNMRAF